MTDPAADLACLESTLALVRSAGPEYAALADSVSLALGHLVTMRERARAMVNAGTTADELRAMAFVQSTLATHAIQEYMRALDPLSHEDTQH